MRIGWLMMLSACTGAEPRESDPFEPVGNSEEPEVVEVECEQTTEVSGVFEVDNDWDAEKLACVRLIDGDLYIRETPVDLIWFSHLEEVTGQLFVDVRLSGPSSAFDQVFSVGGDLTVIASGELPFEWFANLDRVGGVVKLGVAGVPSFTGFGALTHAGGFEVDGAGAYEGPANLKSVDGAVIVRGAVDVSGFDGLAVAGRVELAVPGHHVEGFGALTSVPELTAEAGSFGGFTGLAHAESVDLSAPDGVVDGFPSLASVGELTVVAGSVAGFERLEVAGQIVGVASDAFGGFDGLKEVGTLDIEARLLTGFNGLESYPGDLSLHSRASVSVTGFDSLTTLNGSLLLTGSDLTTVRLEGLRVIEGDLRATTSSLLTVDLPALERVDGDVIFDGVGFIGLPAFPNLINIAGDLTLTDLDELETLNGLSALQTVEGTITMESWPSLKEIDAFHSMTRLDDVRFHGMPDLVSVSGFSSVEELGELLISDAPKLQAISGFDALRVADRLRLLDLPELNTVTDFPSLQTLRTDLVLDTVGFDALPGFPALEEVNGPLTIESLENVTEIGGFPSLVRVAGELKIEQFWSYSVPLKRITGFGQLTEANRITLFFAGSASLDEFSAFSNLTRVGKDVEFSGFSGFPSDATLLPNLRTARTVTIQSIEGLESLDLLPAARNLDVWLSNLDDLHTVTGLDDLRSGFISLNKLDALESVDLAPNVIGGTLSVDRAYRLSAVSGFDRNEGGSYIFSGTALASLAFLADVSVLSSLTFESSQPTSLDDLPANLEVTGLLELRRLYQLTDISSLSTATVGTLELALLDALCEDHAQEVIDAMDVGTVQITDIGSNCPP